MLPAGPQPCYSLVQNFLKPRIWWWQVESWCRAYPGPLVLLLPWLAVEVSASVAERAWCMPALPVFISPAHRSYDRIRVPVLHPMTVPNESHVSRPWRGVCRIWHPLWGWSMSRSRQPLTPKGFVAVSIVVAMLRRMLVAVHLDLSPGFVSAPAVLVAGACGSLHQSPR